MIVKNNKVCAAIVALTCLMWVSDAFSIGMGVSVMKGSETWTNDTFRTHNGDRDISSFGILLDTNIAKDSLFNYRLTIASEDNKAADGAGLNLTGTSFTNDFGFAVYRNSVIKLWLGPQLKAGFYQTEFKDNLGFDADGGAFGWGLGPVFGINVHLPKVVSFSASIAYHVAGFYVGSYDQYDNNGSYQGYRDIDLDYTGGPNLNLSVLFRFGSDNFE